MQARRIFITGVGRGIGKAIAEQLLAAGHHVYGSTRSGTTTAAVLACLSLDQGDEESVTAAASALGEHIQGLDTLINCAGVDAREFDAPVAERGPFDLDAKTFNAVMNVNVAGPMLVTKHLLPLLRRGTDPLIVNISSQLGSMQVAAQAGNDTVYCVSKAALNMLSVKTATALEPEGISVVMMHPGWVQSDMGGSSAALTLDEAGTSIAETISQLSIADTGRFMKWDASPHPW